jgi:mannose-6-phosphate isomerase-like protein (cupin superfamily)
MQRLASSAAIVLVMLTFSQRTFAQSAPATSATDLVKANIDAALLKYANPKAAVIDRILSLVDAGKYNVAVAIVSRPGGAMPSSLSHDKITEIYYILRGSGTQVTGGTMVDPKRGANVSTTIGPSLSSSALPKGGRSSKLGVGDSQIIPPGVPHGWSAIDAGGVDYLVIRIDADHVLAMNPN